MSTDSFSNDVAVSFSNDVENAPDKPSLILSQSNNNGLSKSSRAWDIDGDGKLDDAELALKMMDKQGNGTIGKDEMYALMNANLQTQRELGKMRKIVIGLVGITCVLALANLGTSFAAAILSKDTMTQQGVLVDKVTNHAVRTDMYANIFHEDKEGTELRRRERRLACETSESGEGLSCAFHGHIVSEAHALEMLRLCRAGSDVDVEFTHDDSEEHFCICPPSAGYANYTLDGETVIGAYIHSNEKIFHIRPENAGTDDYLVTFDE